MTRPERLVEHVTELRRHLGERRPVQRRVALDGLALTTATVPAGSELELDLVLEAIFEGVVVSGTITVPWQGECRRCLDPVEGAIAIDVREVFEVKPVDGETWPLVGDEIDLEPIVRDAVLLGLPLAPLCGEDCLGPAPDQFPATVEGDPVPGDEDEPAEPVPVRDPRWAALDDLDLGG